MKDETKIAVLETKFNDFEKNNTKEHKEIQDGIKGIVKEVRNLGNNYITFKSKILVFWGIGIVIISAFINKLINNL